MNDKLGKYDTAVLVVFIYKEFLKILNRKCTQMNINM